jgi:hypothetical protein
VVCGVVVRVEHLPAGPGEPNVAWCVHEESQLDIAFAHADGRASQVVGPGARLGKIYSACPRSVLEHLTPTAGSEANAWRNACWERVLRAEGERRRPIGRGDVVQLPEPAIFTDGTERELFLISSSEPLAGVAFGATATPVPLAAIERLLMPVTPLDLAALPSGRRVEVLTASADHCTGYVLREAQSRAVLGWTASAARAIAVERTLNGPGEAVEPFSGESEDLGVSDSVFAGYTGT